MYAACCYGYEHRYIVWSYLQVQFVTTEDRGPKGSSGRAVFDPALSVSLVITLYRVCVRVDGWAGELL